MINKDKLNSYCESLREKTFKVGGSDDLILTESVVYAIQKYMSGLSDEDELLLELTSNCVPDGGISLCEIKKSTSTDVCVECWLNYLK